jgi:tetratricopeptide (TPR) repeat protein
MNRAAIFGIVVLLASPLLAQQQRIASDFEIARMEKQLATRSDFLSQLSGHLNLGDIRAARNESSLARAEYAKTLDIAARERLGSRRNSDLARYATATSYAALANAKLGNRQRAFELLEESVRYGAGEAKSWNLYATSMSALRLPRKAASAARNAVAIAEAEVRRAPAVSNRLDLAVYQYSLASSLIESEQRAEAERLLVDVTRSLRSPEFAPLVRDVERKESFEIYSSARGDEAAYLSLLNRSQLRLAALYEQRGDTAAARAEYERVLAGRSDDATALAALARLARSVDERERHYAEAFDANPFSLELIRDYQRYLAGAHPAAPDDETTGATMRRALQQLARGEHGAARATLESLAKRFPDNDAVRLLLRQTESAPGVPSFVTANATTATPTAAELRQLLARFGDDKLTPEQRQAVDRITFTSDVSFDATASVSVFESGAIDGVPFRFSEPTQFNGTFAAPTLRLTYRILGATQQNGAEALLLEPLRLEASR